MWGKKTSNANILLIDGENFKGKIRRIFKNLEIKEEIPWHKYDFKGLFEEVLEGIPVDKTIFYFARLKEHKDTPDKSKELIEKQRLLKLHLENQGFDVIFSGQVRGHIENGPDMKEHLIFREKGVDVRIAVDMVSMACDNPPETIILGSSDSDLQPAVQDIKKRDVNCIYLGFEDMPNKGLTYTTQKTILIRNSEVLKYKSIQKKLL